MKKRKAYKYIFESKYLIITWWKKELSSWDFSYISGHISLGKLFIEWKKDSDLI